MSADETTPDDMTPAETADTTKPIVGDPAAGRPASEAPTVEIPAAGRPYPYGPDVYSTARAPRRSIRWGGVVWGAILVVFAVAMLWVVSSHARLVVAEVWLGTLSPASAWTLAFVVAGVIILILALLAVVRSAQRTRRA